MSLPRLWIFCPGMSSRRLSRSIRFHHLRERTRQEDTLVSGSVRYLIIARIRHDCASSYSITEVATLIRCSALEKTSLRVLSPNHPTRQFQIKMSKNLVYLINVKIANHEINLDFGAFRGKQDFNEILSSEQIEHRLHGIEGGDGHLHEDGDPIAHGAVPKARQLQSFQRAVTV